MTASRHMFLPPIMAADQPAGGWLPYILGGLGTGFLAVLQFVLSRQGDRQKTNDAQRQKGKDEIAAADLTLAGLNLKTLAEAREQWRKDIHDEKERSNAEIQKLVVKVEQLDEDNENLKATHVEMYMAIRANQEFFDMLKGRAKDGLITFRVEELPAHIDLAELSPSRVFRRAAAKSQTQQINLNVLPPPKP